MEEGTIASSGAEAERMCVRYPRGKSRIGLESLRSVSSLPIIEELRRSKSLRASQIPYQTLLIDMR